VSWGGKSAAHTPGPAPADVVSEVVCRGTDAEVGSELYRRFEQIAASDPERVAVVADRTFVTYEGLLARADRLQAALRSTGVKAHDCVALTLGNNIGFVVALLAIWRLEAVVIPLDKSLTDTELVPYLRDSGPRTIITSTKRAGIASSLNMESVCIECSWLYCAEDDEWINEFKRPHRMDVAQTNAAYPADRPALTQYSTGSTGTPKRITRTERKLLGELASIYSTLNISASDHVLGVVPFSHSHGLKNAVMVSLFSGATLHILERFLPRDVARLIARERITVYAGVPFMFQQLATLRDRHDFSSLRWPLSGTAPLDAATGLAFESLYSVQLKRVYGTTETGLVTIERQRCGFDEHNRVGMPIPGVSLEIVDDVGSTVPAGANGRVKVISPFAATKYDNGDGKVGSSFDANGYFPGDVGHLGADGGLVISGRYRGSINVGGNKVDPAEVETVLLELDGILEAIVLGIPDASAGEIVKAVLVSSGTVSGLQVREHLGRRLAPFKRPRIVEFRKELPRSPLGKILRANLIEKLRDDARAEE
jgi:long-chain acyl-CoA synthetase